MNLISCSNCGVVLDKDVLPFNDNFYTDDDVVDDTLATWNTVTDEGFTPYVPCPVCKEKVLK